GNVRAPAARCVAEGCAAPPAAAASGARPTLGIDAAARPPRRAFLGPRPPRAVTTGDNRILIARSPADDGVEVGRRADAVGKLEQLDILCRQGGAMGSVGDAVVHAVEGKGEVGDQATQHDGIDAAAAINGIVAATPGEDVVAIIAGQTVIAETTVRILDVVGEDEGCGSRNVVHDHGPNDVFQDECTPRAAAQHKTLGQVDVEGAELAFK